MAPTRDRRRINAAGVGHQLAADGPPRATEWPLLGVSSRLMHIGFIANLCPVAAVVFRSVASADHGSGMLCSGFQGEMALTNTRSGRRGACPAHRSRTGSAGRPLIMVAHRCTPSHAALKLPRPRILLGPSASERSASGALSSCGQSNTRPSASPDGSLDYEC